MNSFAGNWNDGADTITIHQKDNMITSVKFASGPGPYLGFEVDLLQPVICVNFDDIPATGVLSGSKILWHNEATWTRV